MNRKIINTAAITGAYIATLVGAGFASGQEVVSFFIRYGNMGIFAAVLVSAIFGIAAYTVTDSVCMSEKQDFGSYLESIVPQWLTGIIKFIITLFMTAVFCVMAAGCGAALAQLFSISEMTGAAILCIFCFFCFLFDIKAVLAVNGILAPVIVLGILFVCMYILKFREISVFSPNFDFLTDNWLVSGLSYSSYNILTAVVVLVNSGKSVSGRAEAKTIGVLSGIVFFAMLMPIWLVLKIYVGKIELGEVPMLTLALRQGRLFGVFYTVILFAAMLTTALSNGFGVINVLAQHIKLNRITLCALVCTVGFLGAGFGFSRLVGEGYNACGYAGAVLLAAILTDFIKKTIKSEKRSKMKIKRAKSLINR